MSNPLVKFAAQLMLLLTLVFLTGVVSAAASTAGPSASFCCDTADEQPAAPIDESCADHSCGCLCCGSSTLTSDFLFHPSPQAPSTPQRLVVSVFSADYIRSIDYPPRAF